MGRRIDLRVTAHDDVARVLLALAGPLPDLETAREAMTRCESWPLVFRLAQRHRVAGLLARTIRRMGLEGLLPASFRPGIEQACRAAKLKDRYFTVFLSQVLKTLHQAKIPTMLLKGQSLAERLYDEPCDRDSADIDILVPAEATDEALRLLGELGYRPRSLERYRKEHFHVPLAHEQRQLRPIVELHWDLTRPGYPIRFDLRRWWKEAGTHQLRAGATLVPPPDEELVYLAWHALGKGGMTLRELSDISRLFLRSRGAGLEGAAHRLCEASGACGFLQLALDLCRHLWNIPFEQPPAMPPATRRRFRTARTLVNPQRVLFSPGDPWWPFAAICVWSLTPPERSGAPDLFRRALRDVSAYQPQARPLTALLRGGKVIAVLIVALLAARVQVKELGSWGRATSTAGGR